MKPDVLRVIEAAYAEGVDERTWLGGMVEAAYPTLDAGLGVWGFSFGLADGIPKQLGPLVEVGCDGDKQAGLQSALVHAPPHFIRQAFGATRVLTLTELTARLGSSVPPGPGLDTELFASMLRRWGSGAHDALGIVNVDPSARGIVVTVGLPEPRRLSPSFRRTWSRVAAHLGAALRLRTRAESEPGSEEAVLDADGKLQHALGAAQGRDARVALRQAARAIDRAKVARTRDPDVAVELWQALVQERWSLIDRFDSDGRHFLIARRNPMHAPPIRELSARERRVVALAALGRSNKLIAYELGLSTGTVGTLLSRAARKLGVASRSTLIQYWHQAQSAGMQPRR